MTGPFLAALEADVGRVRPTVAGALRLLVADVRSAFGDQPPAQLLVALAKAEEALANDAPTDAAQRSARYRAASLVLREIERDKSEAAQEIVGRAIRITITLRDRATAQVAAAALADVIDAIAAEERAS